jgi:hypothetical protein
VFKGFSGIIDQATLNTLLEHPNVCTQPNSLIF